MAARADELSIVSTVDPSGQRNFDYYADANVFEAKVNLPVKLNTDDQNFSKISGAQPQNIVHTVAPLSADQRYFSYTCAYSELSAQYDTANQGYQTTATGVVTGLNILNVLTADKVVGQISTFYPEGDAVPTVSFLGTQFQNLCIHGQPLVPNQNLGIFGAKPANDGSYFDDAAALSQISAQYYAIVSNPALPASLKSHYSWTPATANTTNKLKCSLANSVSGVPSTDSTCGNVIVMPGFGEIFLEQVELTRTADPDSPDGYDYMFSLEMIRIELQGIGSGTIRIVALDTNGSGSTGPHPAPPSKPPKKPKS
ncbi:MAG: hypothetical protein WB729_14640 [Candidatus Sulfotelmatobacter sp.]